MKKYAARFGERWVETREKDGKAQVRLKPLAEFLGELVSAQAATPLPGPAG